MLRNVVLGFGVLCLVAGLVSIFVAGFPPAIVFGIWGVLIVAGVVFERVRYKPLERAAPTGRWRRTAERFIDDETGEPVTVFIDPETGERKYVRE
jgi:cell division protein FtsW (lipid II flippase)